MVTLSENPPLHMVKYEEGEFVQETYMQLRVICMPCGSRRVMRCPSSSKLACLNSRESNCPYTP